MKTPGNNKDDAIYLTHTRLHQPSFAKRESPTCSYGTRMQSRGGVDKSFPLSFRAKRWSHPRLPGTWDSRDSIIHCFKPFLGSCEFSGKLHPPVTWSEQSFIIENKYYPQKVARVCVWCNVTDSAWISDTDTVRSEEDAEDPSLTLIIRLHSVNHNWRHGSLRDWL